jgi:hypothetical protein
MTGRKDQSLKTKYQRMATAYVVSSSPSFNKKFVTSSAITGDGDQEYSRAISVCQEFLFNRENLSETV